MTDTTGHAALMDATYRHQRRIYDLTRRYFLFGRDTLIDNLAPPRDGRILEVACGTGRNLDRIDRRYPGRALCGLDISEEMLRSARRRLGGRAALAQADARAFDAAAMFGPAPFDRVVLSYSLSMIPDWERALATAAAQLAPGGELHIVDFGDLAGLPEGAGRTLRAWLARFHVMPRETLPAASRHLALSGGYRLAWRELYRGYAQYAVLTRPVTQAVTSSGSASRPW